MIFRRCVAGLLAAVLLSSPAAAAPDVWKAKAREIYARIIAIPTVQGRGKVPEMAAYLASEFRAAGFPEQDVTIVPVGETAALVVRLRGDGSMKKKPILLMAHMDVVEALPADWSKDPFKLTEEDGYFYGRGTLDVKDGVAVLATTLLRLKAEKVPLGRDVILVLTGDEETTGDTSIELTQKHRELIDAEFALNSDAGGGGFDAEGRPMGFGLQAAEKTYASYTLTVTNPGGHSSVPRDDNAIYELAAGLTKLGAYRFPVQTNDITLGYFRESARFRTGETAEAMARFAKNPKDLAAAEIIAREPSENGILRTTCVATMLSGGHAENALPQTAVATVNCRIFPGVSPESVRDTLQGVVGPGVKVAIIGAPLASDASPLRADVMAAYAKAVKARHKDMPIIPGMSAGATDGLYFRAAGIPTYGVDGAWIVAPVDERAHGRDERLPVDAFYADLDHWDVMVRELAAKKKAGGLKLFGKR